MADCYTKLADLDKNRIDWNIQVRCCRKWQIPDHGSVSASMEIVLVDKDSFSDIKHDSFKDKAPMFDIIGNIVNFNDTRMKDDVPIKGSRSVQLLLEDLDEKTFSLYLGEIGISNTYHAIKVVVDLNMEEIVEFSNKLPANGSPKSSNCSQLSNSSFISVTEELRSTAIIFMTLEELKAIDANAKFFCDKRGDYVFGNARFKIHVKVVDGKSNAVFLLWGDVARMLVETSASEICERLLWSFAKDDESGGSGRYVSRLEFPSEVDSLVGRELLFKVGVESRHLEGRDHVYVVERVCDDASIVKMHKSIEHKINDFATRPYKYIVGDTNWDSDPQDDDIDVAIEYKSPERVLGKRDGEFCDEGRSSHL
ncbi:hypothetical protein OROHE_000718 [Orobanche hederae]